MGLHIRFRTGPEKLLVVSVVVVQYVPVCRETGDACHVCRPGSMCVDLRVVNYAWETCCYIVVTFRGGCFACVWLWLARELISSKDVWF